MMLIYNGNSTNLILFDVSRNLFNFKMMEIIEQQYLTNNNNDSLSIFKQFLYHVMKENQMSNIDDLIVFRSEKLFRQSSILGYQNLDPQIRTRNFFLMFDNYLFQLHVSGNTDYTNPMTFNNVMESDLNRRFTSVILNFMDGVNPTMERMLAETPLSLIFTENSNRFRNMRPLSYRRILETIIRNYGNTNGQSDSLSKFQHHFREYAEYVNEIITSHEMWLQDRVNAFGMVEMSRRETIQSYCIGRRIRRKS